MKTVIQELIEFIKKLKMGKIITLKVRYEFQLENGKYLYSIKYPPKYANGFGDSLFQNIRLMFNSNLIEHNDYDGYFTTKIKKTDAKQAYCYKQENDIIISLIKRT